MPNVLKVDGVVVLIRRLGFQRMEIHFTKLVLDRIEFYSADFLLCTNITFLLGQGNIDAIEFVDLLLDRLLS